MSRPMSRNGYSWVEGRVADGRDASGMCLQDTLITLLKPSVLALIQDGKRCPGIPPRTYLDCRRPPGYEVTTCPDLWRFV